MKKILLFTAALAALLSAASCQKEEMGAVEAGNGNVTFTIQTPEDAVTKAIGDGTNVDIVYYEIYKADEKGQPVDDVLVDDTVKMSNKEATLTLNLLEDQKYVALFWAQVHRKEGEQKYYNVENLLKVEALYPNTKSNLEERAAFYQKFVFSTENAVNETVTLVRPFAQINIGTTLESLDMDYEVDVTASSVTVANPARFFNVNNGVGHTATTAAVVFGEETNPQEALIVNNDEYEYVAMNYILVDGARSTVNVDFSIVTDKGTVTKTVADVPVAQNYRTNLLGNLLTKETKIEIVVDERFADYEGKYEGGKYGEIDGQIYVKVESAEELVAAVADENVDMVFLTENVTLTNPFVIQSSLVLNLNGYTITGGIPYATGVTGTQISAITVDNGATLTIDGEGLIQGTEYGVYAKNGNLVIKSGNFSASTSAVQIAAANVNIEGGTFSNTGSDKRYVINCLDANWKDKSAKVNITGGTFHNFNPANNAAEGAGTNFVAEGYKAVETAADVYTVIPNSAAIAADNTAVEAALDDTAIDTIYLNEGKYTIEMYTNFTAKKSLTIIGTEGTQVAFSNSQVRLYLAENFTIQDCEILHMATKDWGMLVFSTGDSADGVYTVSNCTFNGFGTQGIYINEENSGAVYNIENCTFNGDFGSKDGAVTIQNNRGVAFTVNVTGCTFNMTNGSHEISHHYNDSAFTLNTDVDSSKIYCKEN